MRAQGARASPGSPRIQTVIRADPRKADDVILIGFKAIILAKISNYLALIEGTIWAVKNLLNLLKRCGGVDSLIRAKYDPPLIRPLANRSYLTAYYI
jgi:hypothetical protein